LIQPIWKHRDHIWAVYSYLPNFEVADDPSFLYQDPNFSSNILILYCSVFGCRPCHACRCSANVSASGCGIRGIMPIFTMTLPGKFGVILCIGFPQVEQKNLDNALPLPVSVSTYSFRVPLRSSILTLSFSMMRLLDTKLPATFLQLEQWQR